MYNIRFVINRRLLNLAERPVGGRHIFIVLFFLMTSFNNAHAEKTEENKSYGFYMTSIQTIEDNKSVVEVTSHLSVNTRLADTPYPNVNFGQEEKVLESIEENTTEVIFGVGKKLSLKETDLFYLALNEAGFIELASASALISKDKIEKRQKLNEYLNEKRQGGEIIDIHEKPFSYISLHLPGTDTYAYYFDQPLTDLHKSVMEIIDDFVRKHELDIPDKSGENYGVRYSEVDHIHAAPVDISIEELANKWYEYNGKRVRVTGFNQTDHIVIGEENNGILSPNGSQSGPSIALGNISKFARADTIVHSGWVKVEGTFDSRELRIYGITTIEPIKP